MNRQRDDSVALSGLSGKAWKMHSAARRSEKGLEMGPCSPPRVSPCCKAEKQEQKGQAGFRHPISSSPSTAQSGDSESHWRRRGKETAGAACQGEGERVLPRQAAEDVPRGSARAGLRQARRSQLGGRRWECTVGCENVSDEAGENGRGRAPSALGAAG